jgi:hypothetical protein
MYEFKEHLRFLAEIKEFYNIEYEYQLDLVANVRGLREQMEFDSIKAEYLKNIYSNTDEKQKIFYSKKINKDFDEVIFTFPDGILTDTEIDLNPDSFILQLKYYAILFYFEEIRELFNEFFGLIEGKEETIEAPTPEKYKILEKYKFTDALIKDQSISSEDKNKILATLLGKSERTARRYLKSKDK